MYVECPRLKLKLHHSVIFQKPGQRERESSAGWSQQGWLNQPAQKPWKGPFWEITWDPDPTPGSNTWENLEELHRTLGWWADGARNPLRNSEENQLKFLGFRKIDIVRTCPNMSVPGSAHPTLGSYVATGWSMFIPNLGLGVDGLNPEFLAIPGLVNVYSLLLNIWPSRNSGWIPIKKTWWWFSIVNLVKCLFTRG